MRFRKPLALLVWLALRGPTPRTRLGSVLWPDLDEPTARRNLRRELARLREAGGDGLVVAHGDSLALGDDVDTDTRRFERASTDGLLDEALTLVRGPLADGLELDDAPAFAEMLASAREQWRLAWRTALERAADAAAARADWPLALAQVRRLLDDDPLQESHHARAIQWLASAGDRAAALTQYERCAELLRTELGLQPLDTTQALATALRGPGIARPQGTAGPAALAAAGGTGSGAGGRPTPPAHAPADLPDPLPFVGRHREVAQLEAAWQQGGTLVIEGEGGLGKTRLALDLASAHGATALVRCRPGDARMPYAVFTRALHALAGESPAAVPWPAWLRTELTRLLPSLGPPPPAMQGDEERARFVAACGEAWRMLTQGSFDAVVIDDWQHADAPSRALIVHIAAHRRQPAAAPLATSAREIITCRSSELEPDARQQLDALAQSPGSCRCVLGPWREDELFDLVQQLSGSAAPTRFTARLMQATQGHPLFVLETLRHLVATGELRDDGQGRWQTPYDDLADGYSALSVPASVHDAVRRRVAALGDAARRLLEAASLASEPLDLPLLAAACALDEVEAGIALEQALEAGLLRSSAPGRLAFAHDLVLQAVASGLTPERQRLVHRRLALGAQKAGAEPARVALHFESAGEPLAAVPWRLAAAEAAERLLADEQAVAHWQAALNDGATGAQALQAQVRLARRWRALGRGDHALAAVPLLDALRAGSLLDDDGRCHAAIEAARLLADMNRAAEGLARIDDVLQALPAAHARRAEALEVRSDALKSLGRLSEAEAAALQALACEPPPPLRASLTDSLTLIAYRRGQPAQALEHAERALAAYRSLGDLRGMAVCQQRAGVMHLLLGDVSRAEQALQATRALCMQHRMLEQQRMANINLIKLYTDRGDAAGALALAEEAWNLSPSFTRPETRQVLHQAFFYAHYLRGDLGAALDRAEVIVAEARAIGEPTPLQNAAMTVLDLFIWLDDVARARELLAMAASAHTRELGYLGVKLAFNRCFLELRSGDLQAAAEALDDVGDPAALEEPQDRATHALRSAELAVVRGDLALAWTQLAPWAGPPAVPWPNVELQALFLAARLRAAPDAAARDAEAIVARQALAAGRLPALEALELRAALAGHDPAEAGPLRAHAERLHATLAAHPEAAARFSTRWLS